MHCSETLTRRGRESNKYMLLGMTETPGNKVLSGPIFPVSVDCQKEVTACVFFYWKKVKHGHDGANTSSLGIATKKKGKK